MFNGLSAFPITPLKANELDFDVLHNIRDHIDASGVDSIGVLGSTGSFAYLTNKQRIKVMECWGECSTPWIAGVSATTTKQAVDFANIANQNGAQGIIANAFSYVQLNKSELTRYFLTIADNSSLPLCVYDNPNTTGQSLDDELLALLSKHPNIQATKVFAKSENTAQHQFLSRLDWHTGYAVDANCCEAMIAGGNTWYSTLAGTLPEALVPIMSAIKLKEFDRARELNKNLMPLYELMKEYSGYRIMHLIANIRGWQCELPSPLLLPEIEASKISACLQDYL